MPLPASQANLQQQERDYQSVVQQCKAVAGCVGITVWDFTDKACASPRVILDPVIVLIVRFV